MKIEDAIQLLKKNDFKMTNRRKKMIEFFMDAGGYRTAKEVNIYMESIYEGISFDTVYRNLHLFTEIGILESTELNGEKHFQITCTTSHHHHFICRKCGMTKEIHLCPMDELFPELEHYKVEDHKFEVYGLCPNCMLSA